MCEYCLKIICPSGCPNSDCPRECFKCEFCSDYILEGYDYYDIDGIIICEDCIDDFKRVAEFEEYEPEYEDY